ncbi:MAG: hypothetical protein AVDCRST_MAG25-1345, partial [uncultured Rubrobacteraceae bacterium]
AGRARTQRGCHTPKVRSGGQDGRRSLRAVLRLPGRGVPGPDAGGPLPPARREGLHRPGTRAHHGGAAGGSSGL